MRIVLDTNVLVSALLTPGGAEARLVFDFVVRDPSWRLEERPGQAGSRSDLPVVAFVILVDERILAEYAEVLARPKFKKIGSELRDRLIEQLRSIAQVVEAPPPVAGSTTPAQDLPFLEVAIAGAADFLVTGNAKDFPDTGDVEVMSARLLLRLLEG